MPMAAFGVPVTPGPTEPGPNAEVPIAAAMALVRVR